MNRRALIVLLFLAALFLLISCADDTEDPIPQPSAVPTGYARVSGTVRDSSGTLQSGVGLHVNYVLSPHSAFLSDNLARTRHASLDTVSLLSFVAVGGEGRITLSWVTASESDNDSFTVVRGGGPVAHIPTQGNGTTPHYYQWVDLSVNPGVMYTYWLYSVDINGVIQNLASDSAIADTAAYTPEESVLHPSYPNPVVDTVNFWYELTNGQSVLLTIKQKDGSFIDTVTLGTYPTGVFGFTYEMNSLPNGRYEYRMRAGAYDTTMVLLKNSTNHLEPAAYTTAAEGTYSLDLAVGDTIRMYDSDYHYLGYDVLRQVHLTAKKSGFADEDVLLTLTNQERQTLNFTLTP
jgi:hypothetical protein